MQVTHRTLYVGVGILVSVTAALIALYAHNVSAAPKSVEQPRLTLKCEETPKMQLLLEQTGMSVAAIIKEEGGEFGILYADKDGDSIFMTTAGGGSHMCVASIGKVRYNMRTGTII